MQLDFLAETGHRPYALPEGRYTMQQTWCDLLFAHWACAPEALRPFVPKGLELDLFDGRAWLGVVPFHMTGIRHRLFPGVPGLSAFGELNVRTYVVRDGKPGVWFVSLDAASAVAVEVARRWFHLPYFRADIAWTHDGDDVVYRSVRDDGRGLAVSLEGRYGPTGPVLEPAAPGSLAYWLTERYCLYARSGDGRIHRGDIHHRPWPLQPAKASLSTNTMGRQVGLELDGEPDSLLFARRIDTVVWGLKEVGAEGESP